MNALICDYGGGNSRAAGGFLKPITKPLPVDLCNQLEFIGVRHEIELLELALTVRPRDVGVLARLATLFRISDDPFRRTDILWRLIALVPCDPNLHFELALSLAQSNQLTTAVTALHEAVRLGFGDADRFAASVEETPLRSHPSVIHLTAKLIPPPNRDPTDGRHRPRDRRYEGPQ